MSILKVFSRVGTERNSTYFVKVLIYNDYYLPVFLLLSHSIWYLSFHSKNAKQNTRVLNLTPPHNSRSRIQIQRDRGSYKVSQ